MKLLKWLAWILFFPFMLTHWGWKRGKKPVAVAGMVLSALFIYVAAFSSDEAYTDKQPPALAVAGGMENPGAEGASDAQEDVVDGLAADPGKTRGADETGNMFDGYRVLAVDGGDLSGIRQANVAVDIGFGDREYWAFTNEYGQLVKVVAQEIVLQDEAHEPVLSTGRYYSDEAKVPGVESPDLDEGHVIADSLGGVANAYNITPQNSSLNRHGDQAYMEDQIRLAGGCSDFVALITYPDTNTQIPSHYSFTYILKGTVIHDEFDNINPDDANAAPMQEHEEAAVADPETANEAGTVDGLATVRIMSLDKKEEYVILENIGSAVVDLDGWMILSERGEQTFVFSEFVLEAGGQVMVGGYDSRETADFIWEDGSGVWNNSKSDPAVLYDADGIMVDRYTE